MTGQPFPSLNSKMTGPDGAVTPVWRAFFQTLWDRGGGAIGAAFASINGNKAQRFEAAHASGPYDVVPLAQASALYQPIGAYAALAGNTAQTFGVADAAASTDATSLQQANTLIAASAALSVTLAGPQTITGTKTFSAPVVTAPTTVAALPAATAGARSFVTDALAPVFGVAVVGGGAVPVPVYHDGTQWSVG